MLTINQANTVEVEVGPDSTDKGFSVKPPTRMYLVLTFSKTIGDPLSPVAYFHDYEMAAAFIKHMNDSLPEESLCYYDFY